MRSLMWTGIFCLLVAELVLTLLLVIPLPRSIRNFIVLQVSKLELKKRFQIPITILFFALCFALLDTANYLSQVYTKKEGEYDEKGGLPITAGMDRHILKEKEYKAARNLYLAGFALTLLFVIGRITELMQEHAELSEKNENLKLAFSMVQNVDPQSLDSPTATTQAKIFSDVDDLNQGLEMKPMRSKKKD